MFVNRSKTTVKWLPVYIISIPVEVFGPPTHSVLFCAGLYTYRYLLRIIEIGHWQGVLAYIEAKAYLIRCRYLPMLKGGIVDFVIAHQRWKPEK